MRLVGTGEIRVLLGGVSKQRTYEITSRKGFPDPIATLMQGRIWDAAAVEKWIKENRADLS